MHLVCSWHYFCCRCLCTLRSYLVQQKRIMCNVDLQRARQDLSKTRSGRSCLSRASATSVSGCSFVSSQLRSAMKLEHNCKASPMSCPLKLSSCFYELVSLESGSWRGIALAKHHINRKRCSIFCKPGVAVDMQEAKLASRE